jgi:lipoate-protein ligase A
MAEIWRLIDTGLRLPAQNIALDRALLEARRAEEIPSTLRFLRFPDCALIGCDRSAGQELNLEYCQAAGLHLQRRITGGDVMWLDENQLVWELYLHRRDIGAADLKTVSRRLCHAAAAGVSALGVDARYRPHGDIEVDGRTVSYSAGVFDGDALLFQGTLLLDRDPASLPQASRLPDGARALARDRIASLKQLLGAKPDAALVKRYLAEAFESEFSVEFGDGDLTLSENARYQAALREIDHPDWTSLVSLPAADVPVLAAEQRLAGGRLSVTVVFDRRARALRQVWFGGDIEVRPRRAVPDLEAALRQAPLDRLESRVAAFFGSRAVDTSLEPRDFVNVVWRAIGQVLTASLDEKNEL